MGVEAWTRGAITGTSANIRADAFRLNFSFSRGFIKVITELEPR